MNLLPIKIFLKNFRSHSPLTTEVVLYIVVGLLGAVIDFGCFFVLINLATLPMVAQWTAALVGFLHNHLWHHFFVFKHRQGFKRTTFWSMVISIFAIVVSGPALVLLQAVYENFIFNKIVVLGLTTVFLFGIRKLFIFKDKEIEVILD